MITHEEVFRIGRLGSAHGLKGYLDLHYTDDIFTSEDCTYLVLDIDGLLVPFFLEDWQVRTDDLAMVKFEGYDDVKAVELLQNAHVYYPKAAVSKERTQLSSWQMLTGFSVSDTKAGPLGTVTEVDNSTANVLLVITRPTSQELVLPIHPDLVDAIDIGTRTLTLNMPEGLL